MNRQAAIMCLTVMTYPITKYLPHYIVIHQPMKKDNPTNTLGLITEAAVTWVPPMTKTGHNRIEVSVFGYNVFH